MTTTKSFSEKSRFFSLYRTALKHQFPMLVVFFILFFLTLILPLILVPINDPSYFARREFYDSFTSPMQYGIYLASEMSVFIAGLVGVMALITALEAGSYIQQKRMVDLYHALPVTRTQLFTSKLLASMTTIFLPLLANYLFATLLYGLYWMMGMPLFDIAGPLFHLLFTVQDLAGLGIYALVVYLFVTFICYHVGTVFDVFAISGVLGVAGMVVYVIPPMIWENTLYGASFTPSIAMLLLSPFTFLFFKFDELSSMGNLFYFETVPLLLLYAGGLLVAGLLFFFCIRAYNRRKSEKAEQPQPSGVFQILVKIFAAFCGSALFYAFFMETGVVAQAIAVVIGGVLIGTIAELILSRGLRAYGKNLKWLAGTGVAFSLFLITINMDLTGFETRVPEPVKVAGVQLDYRGRGKTLYPDFLYQNFSELKHGNYVLTDPDSVAVITNAHRTLLENRAPERYYGDDVNYIYEQLFLTYNLKSGGSMTRYYSGSLPRLVNTALMELEDNDDFIAATHPLFYWKDGQLANSRMAVSQLTLSNNMASDGRRVSLSPANIDLLIEAIKADLLAETLEGMANPNAPALGYITMRFAEPHEYDQGYYGYTPVVYVVVTGEYQNTIALLKSLGHYDKMVTADEKSVERVYITNPQYDVSSGSRIAALTPGSNLEDGVYREVYNYKTNLEATDGRDGKVYTAIYASLSDPADVALVLKNTRNQMAVSGGSYQENIYCAVFESADGIVGARLIRYQDLPMIAQLSIAEHNN